MVIRSNSLRPVSQEHSEQFPQNTALCCSNTERSLGIEVEIDESRRDRKPGIPPPWAREKELLKQRCKWAG